jgi:hypothetical protein
VPVEGKIYDEKLFTSKISIPKTGAVKYATNLNIRKNREILLVKLPLHEYSEN